MSEFWQIQLRFLEWVSVMSNKMKSHSGARKRFRATASGKVKRNKAGKSHLNSQKSGKRLRKLRSKVVEGGKMGVKYALARGK